MDKTAQLHEAIIQMQATNQHFPGALFVFSIFCKINVGIFFIYVSFFFSKMIFFLPCCCLRCNGLSVFRERKYFTVISKISAFSILEYLETCRKQTELLLQLIIQRAKQIFSFLITLLRLIDYGLLHQTNIRILHPFSWPLIPGF